MELRKEPRLREGKGGRATHTARMSCIPCVDPISDVQGGGGGEEEEEGVLYACGTPSSP